MKLTTDFTPVHLPSGRCVGFGHEVTNFGQKGVITGFYPEIGCFQLRSPRSSGMGFHPGSWVGNPERCK